MKRYSIKIEKGVARNNSKSSEKIVYICRHGETDAVKNKYFATDNISINDSGIQDAIKIRQQFVACKGTGVYSSPFQRTLETSRIICNQFTIIDALSERDYGDWKGKTKREIFKENPLKYYLGKCIPSLVSPKNGESLVDLYNRRDYILDLIWNSMEPQSLIVTHGSIIHSIMMYPQRKYFGDYWRFTKKNCISCGDIYTLRILKLC